VILAVGIPVAVVVLALVALRLFLPLDKVKDLATARLSEQLGREVTVADVGLSLRGGLGIVLRDVVIADPHGTGDGRLLEAAGLDLKLETGPLLHREVRVHRLVLRSPRVTLWQLADGSNNFTFVDTMGASGQAPVSAPAAETEAVAVSVAVLEIQDGSLTYRDEIQGTEMRLVGLALTADLDDPGQGRYRSTGRLAVDSLLVTAEEPVPPLTAELVYDVTYELEAGRVELHEGAFTVNGFSGTVTGEFQADDADPQATGHLEIAPVDLADILALMTPEQRDPLADLTLAGRVGLSADLDWDAGRAEPLAYAAQAALTGLTVKHVDVAGELQAAAVRADIAPDMVDLRTENVTFAGEPLRVAAVVWDFEDPRLEATLEGAMDLALAEPFLPPELAMKVGGRGTFNLAVSGRTADPESFVVTGDLAVMGGRLAAPQMPEPVTRLDAALVLEPDALDLQRCEVQFPSGDLSLTGRLDHLRSFMPESTGGPTPHLEFAARSRRFDVDKLFPAAVPAAEGPGASPATASVAGADTPEMPDLTAAGTFEVDTLVYSHVDFTSVSGRATYIDRRMVCDPVTAEVYTGRAAGKVSIDLSDMNEPQYAGEFRVRRIEADDFLSRFTSFGGAVFGKTDLTGSFSAAGREPARIKETMTLDAAVNLTDGRLVTAGAVQSSLGTLASKAGVDLDREQVLRDLVTSVQVRNGQVHLERMRTRLGSFGDLTLDGHYNFTGELAYGGALLLTPETTRRLLAQSGILGDLLGSNAPERLNLPLTLGGSFKSPKLAVDYTALTKELTRGVAEEAGDKLKDLLRKKFGK